MKRRAIKLVFALCLVTAVAFGQEKSGEGGEGEGGLTMWKWANFVVLAGAIIYAVGKAAPPFFQARSLEIRKEILEAQEARKKAEARAAEVEARMAKLETEIASLRQEAHDETRNETERITRQTAAELAKIQTHAEQEIAAAGKAARAELKRYSASLAIQLAETKIRARMTDATEDALVESFVHDLK